MTKTKNMLAEIGAWLRALELRVNRGETPLQTAISLAVNRGFGHPRHPEFPSTPITMADLGAAKRTLARRIMAGEITLTNGIDSAYNLGVERHLTAPE
jgi:hypothetical protein